MSDLPIASRQFEFVTPPRAHPAAGVTIGEVVAFAVSTTAGYIELDTLLQPVYNASAAQTQTTAGVTGHYVTIYADGADLGLICGATSASVSGGNVPVLATVGTVNGSGVYTPAAGTCFRILAGTSKDFCFQKTQDLFMGFVASAAGTLRMYQSSPPNP